MCTGHTPAISSAEASVNHDTVFVGLDVHKESITVAIIWIC
jgi:transposase